MSTSPEHRPIGQPFLRVVWVDPEVGCRGYAVIDRLVDELAGGGIRMRSGVTSAEVESLARVMTLKKALSGALGGGAKGGIDFDPQDRRAPDVLRRYVAAMSPLFRAWWSTAGDLGVSEAELAAVFAEQGLGLTVQALVERAADPGSAAGAIATALGLTVDGMPLGDCTAGYGVAAATVAALEHADRETSGATVAVQGFGTVGGAAARALAARGLRVVGVADAAGLVVDHRGLEVDDLLASRDGHGTIDRSRLLNGCELRPGGEWLAQDVDVLVPAAVEHAIDRDGAERVTAGLVVEAANLPTTVEAQERLRARGVRVVPDLVANGGTTAWFTWLATGAIEPDAGQTFDQLDGLMTDLVPTVLHRADEHGITTHEAARALAEERLASRARGPVI